MGRPGKPIDPTESLTSCYGQKIRTLRESRGWSQGELGKKIGETKDGVSRLELGKQAPANGTGKLLDQVLQAGDYFETHAPLVRKEHAARVPESARSLIQSEREASRLRIYEPGLITGLFQIESYTRALALAGVRAREVDGVWSERCRRQAILDSESAPLIFAVMDEVAIRRPIGGPGVLKEQLAHLERLLERPNINIQIVPSDAGAYCGMTVGFTLVSFGFGTDDVAYVEGPVRGTGQFLHRPEVVQELRDMPDLIRASASSAAGSARTIRSIWESL
ncbi:helix-turn-helix domain-containing protein [Actinomadura logoneensis]|uniref:Helix-turn-helix domain-containing protein n=1 Tax=Actinomadura logoneensis TaxID=2293572 RepID=A0A372JKX4_9ACTN|nr:Scr1 family TA system antitoxin-like transcriptional regulator [Actinomadura logoneensis]RFU40494.1 helix-turn-helix domain-containing protein [Actinomadura logoneensis]